MAVSLEAESFETKPLIITPALLEGNFLVKITKGKEVFEHQISLQPDQRTVYRLGSIYYALEDLQWQPARSKEMMTKAKVKRL